ncbi:MAG: NUDIX hydrolase [Thermodesulfobacteriota bacterium]
MKEVATLRPASTVILVRQHGGEVQVYLLKRSPTNRFFPGTYVFPGGEVDREDEDMILWASQVAMDRKDISQRLGGGISEAEAVAYGITAIRETFEEAGILLYNGTGPSGADMEALRSRRMQRGLSRGWLKELVLSDHVQLSLSRLVRWAHWITPEGLPKRYDTRFLMAFMPPGQECTPDYTETTHGIWVSPYKALVGNSNAEIPLSPPTLVTVHQLLNYPELVALQAEGKSRLWGDALLPRMIKLRHGTLILEPWDARYDDEVEVDERTLEKAILPPGKPFSRIWYHEGIWRPVRS